MDRNSDNRRYFAINVDCEESKLPLLLDISSFLFDFNLTYEITRLSIDEKYSAKHVSAARARFRRGIPLEDDDRLRVHSMRHESPLEFTVWIPWTISGLSVTVSFASVLMNAYGFPLQRRNALLDVLKKEKDLGVISQEELLDRLQRSEGYPILQGVLERLTDSAIQLKNITLEIIDRVQRPKK